MPYAITAADIDAAGARIQGRVRVTPVHTSRTADQRAGRDLFFKCENFQSVGAFKFRGASNALALLSGRASPPPAVVTHSSGNHAQAVALAAREYGIPAHIVMPTNAPVVKRLAVEAYGAVVHPCPPTLVAREQTAETVMSRTGGEFIHPYDDARVMAGQGTVAVELLEQVADLDALVVPVGGGGLLSGICIAAKQRLPAIRIFAAEPRGADDAARSMSAGRLIPQTDPHTIADGLLTSLGELTWPIIRDHVEEVLTVSDQQIRDAMEFLWQRMKLVVEPSGAVGLAAAWSDRFRSQPSLQRVGVVLTGGNVALPHVAVET